MADFRRFYNHGLEHSLQLEELERSTSRLKNSSTKPRPAAGAARRWLARTLTAWAKRIDPARVPHGNKATPAVS